MIDRLSINTVMIKLPSKPAIEPSMLIAPSVPGDTGFKVVIRKVLLPNLLPISLEKVSESFALKLEAKPTMNKFKKFGQKQLNKASEQPVAAEPQTFSGPRLPPLASAIPREALFLYPIFVTNVPNKRYTQTDIQPFQPIDPNKSVPSTQA